VRGATCGRPGEQQITLPGIAGQAGGALQLLARLVEPAEPGEQIAAHAGQQVVVSERRIAGERPLGPDDPLRHGRLGDQERPGDLRGGQPAEQPEGERDPAVRR
jgi:hypothetical protein